MPKTLNVGVKAVIVNRGKALILRRQSRLKPGGEFWDLPGGRIDGDESIEQALDRELHEEIRNLAEYRRGEILNAYRISGDFSGGIGLVLIFFEVFAPDLKEVELSTEHKEYRWVNRAEFKQLEQSGDVEMGLGYKRAIELALTK